MAGFREPAGSNIKECVN